MARSEERTWSKQFLSAQRLESYSSPEAARYLVDGLLACSALLRPTLDDQDLASGVLAQVMALTCASSGSLVVNDPRVAITSHGAPPTSLERHVVDYVHHTGFTVVVPAQAEHGPLMCVPLVSADGPLVRGVILLHRPVTAPLFKRAELELTFLVGRQLLQALQLRPERTRIESGPAIAESLTRCAAMAASAAASAAESAKRAERAAQQAHEGARRAGETAGSAAPKLRLGPPRAATSSSVSTGKSRVSSPTMTMWVALGSPAAKGAPRAEVPMTMENVFEGTTPSLGWLDEV